VEENVGFAVRLDAARDGAVWALNALYEAHHPALVRYLAARRPGDAVEVAASVWRDVASALDEFDGDERDFRAWILALARSRGRSEIRGAGIVRELRPQVQQALECIELLSDDECDVVLLQAVGGLSTDEVALVINRSPAGVRLLQQRALRSLLTQRTAREVVA
jgi:RNA polymerase sigma-70 factor (ECF subfamily)